MITVKLGTISITGIGNSSGLFIGNQNRQKTFRSQQVINEVLGTLSGNENTVEKNKWIKNKH